jgi:hypothetical protein
MRYRLLGRTGLYVSEICLGTMTYGGKGALGGGRTPRRVRSAGPDQQPSTPGSTSSTPPTSIPRANPESIVGRSARQPGSAARGSGRRDQGARRMGPGPSRVGLTRVHIMNEAHASLRRLALDHIDLCTRSMGWTRLPRWKKRCVRWKT